MPIRINFLAERQAEDEVRRRDPFKRAILVAVGLVVVTLAWGSARQYDLLQVRRETKGHREALAALTNYPVAVSLNNQWVATSQRLQDLRQRAANRFLWAPALHALQFAMVDDVRLVRVRGQQQYSEVPRGTNVAAKALVMESLRISMIGRDRSKTGRDPKEGTQIAPFQEAIKAQLFFATNLAKGVELENRVGPVENPEKPGEFYVEFYLNCDFRERTF